MRAFRLLALAVVLLAASPALAAGGVSEIVANVLASYGGLAQWSSVDTIAETGQLASTMRGSAPLFRSFRFPATLRVEVDYAGTTELRMYSNGRGWRDGTEVTGPQLGAMVLQAARMALPRILVDPAVKVADHGTSEITGAMLHELEVTLPGGETLLLHIDPKTNLILRSIGRATVAPGGPRIEFVTEYSDFRKVDGLVFAFHEINYAQGMKTGETTLEKVHIEQAKEPSSKKPQV